MSQRAKHLVRRALGVAGAGALFGVAAYAAFELAARVRTSDAKSSATPKVESEPPPGETAPPPGDIRRPPRPTMRDLIQKALAAAPVKDPSQLEAYLASLEAQARRHGEVTALDIEPGSTLAEEHAGPERARAFGDRMRALQRDLAARKAPDVSRVAGSGNIAPPPVAAVPPMTTATMSAGLARIGVASGAEKQTLIRQYLDVAQGLPEEEEQRRLTQLNEVIGLRRAPVDLSAVDTLWARIQSAPDAASRQPLVRQYLQLVTQLPEEEGNRRLEEVNRRFSVPSARPTDPGAAVE